MRWREFNKIMKLVESGATSSKKYYLNNRVLDVPSVDNIKILIHSGFWFYRLVQPVNQPFTFLQKIIFHRIIKNYNRNYLRLSIK